jgi:hypothetical protein
VSDVTAGKKKRTGRPAKDEKEKRVPLSLRIDPELRKALEGVAKQENRSLTQLSEFALAAFLETHAPGDTPKEVSSSVSLSPAAARSVRRKRASDADRFSLQRLLAMLETAFGRQIAGLLCCQGYAMLIAELDSIAWSRDVAGRPGQFPHVTARTWSAPRQRQLRELWDFLHQSSPARKAEQSWLSDDPYVFGQVASAARQVLATLTPKGSPSPRTLPRGISRAAAVDIMKRLGEDAAFWALDRLTAAKPTALRSFGEPEPRQALNVLNEADLARLKQYLGDDIVARLRQRLPADGWDWPSDAPTEEQNG